MQTDLDAPARAIEEFMMWHTETANHRPVVAYNGWTFDFEVLHDHIIEYCPRHEADWTSTYWFDSYQWVVEEDNAIPRGERTPSKMWMLRSATNELIPD